MVDPDGPTLTAWVLHDGEYVEVAHVDGGEEYAAVTPFEVTVSPAGLRA